MQTGIFNNRNFNERDFIPVFAAINSFYSQLCSFEICIQLSKYVKNCGCQQKDTKFSN